jgi:hypothetical protein
MYLLYTHIYVCMYLLYTHIYMYVCIYYTHTHTHTHAHTQTHTNTHTQTHTHTHIYMYLWHTHIYVYIYVYIYYTHIYVCMYVFTIFRTFVQLSVCVRSDERIFFFFWFFWDRISLYSPGCPGTHFVDQAGLELRNPPASAFQVLGLKWWLLNKQINKVTSSLML